MAYRIKVFFPRPDGRIALRTQFGWDSNVEAAEVGDDGARWEFTVWTDQPYFYFKPVLIGSSGELRWSVGSNYLAITTAPEGRNVYPHFFGGTTGDITRPIDVGGPAQGAGSAPRGGP